MADYTRMTRNIMPVDFGELHDETRLYQYHKKRGIWREYSHNRLGKICKSLAGKEFTQHMLRSFKLNLTNHPDYIHYTEMGTPPSELPIKNGKKLMLGNAQDPENIPVEDIQKKDYAIHNVNAEYDPDADCPSWIEFVTELLDQDEEQIKTLQEFMGWLLKYPDREHKKALLILGVSNSGKSQVAEVIEEMFKKDVGSSITQLSLPQIGYRRRFLLQKLQDSIINLDKDLSSTIIDDPANVKLVVSQEKIAVEPKGEDSMNIQPRAKHVVCANQAPKIEDQLDDAFYGRFLTLKAPNEVPKPDRIEDLGKKLVDNEAEGILNWMLEGLYRLEKNGQFTIEPTPYETRKSWMEFGDSANRFLWENCDVTENVDEDFIEKDDLYERYKKWIEGKMMDTQPRNEFKSKVAEHPGISRGRKEIAGVMERCFLGIKCNYNKYDLVDDRDQEE